MNATQYLDRLLLRYSGTFNIYKPYRVEDYEVDAYGYFYNHLEKYVLVRDANLWSSDSYEHVFFVTQDKIDLACVKQLKKIIEEYGEPKLVRKGEKLPDKNHMYSYLSVIFVSEKITDKEVIKEIKKYHFEKGYMMNMRGYSQAHFGLVITENGRVETNSAGRKKKKILEEVYKEVQENKIGFEELCEKHNIEPFKQEAE